MRELIDGDFKKIFFFNWNLKIIFCAEFVKKIWESKKNDVWEWRLKSYKLSLLTQHFPSFSKKKK